MSLLGDSVLLYYLIMTVKDVRVLSDDDLRYVVDVSR